MELRAETMILKRFISLLMNDSTMRIHRRSHENFPDFLGGLHGNSEIESSLNLDEAFSFINFVLLRVAL